MSQDPTVSSSQRSPIAFHFGFLGLTVTEVGLDKLIELVDRLRNLRAGKTEVIMAKTALREAVNKGAESSVTMMRLLTDELNADREERMSAAERVEEECADNRDALRAVLFDINPASGRATSIFGMPYSASRGMF